MFQGKKIRVLGFKMGYSNFDVSFVLASLAVPLRTKWCKNLLDSDWHYDIYCLIIPLLYYIVSGRVHRFTHQNNKKKFLIIRIVKTKYVILPNKVIHLTLQKLRWLIIHFILIINLVTFFLSINMILNAEYL